MSATRVVLVTIAVAACTWFALGVRAADEQGAVAALLDHHTSLTAPQARTARAQIAAAQTLNPDQTLNILRAQVELRSGHLSTAVAIAQGVVRREPQNAAAWLVLAVLTGRTDPATNRLARARLRQLVPPVT